MPTQLNTLVGYFYDGNIEGVVAALELGLSVDHDESGYRPLHYATINGHNEVVTLLLDRGADIEARAPDGRTPLYFAVLHNHVTTVRLLLERGADINTQDNAGASLLIQSTRSGYTEVTKVLLEHHADYSLADMNGTTATGWGFLASAKESVALIDEARAGGTASSPPVKKT